MYTLLKLRGLEHEFGFAVLFRNHVVAGYDNASEWLMSQADGSIVGYIKNCASEAQPD
jgi:hypothetical protein